MKLLKKLLKIVLWGTGVLIVLLFAFALYVWNVSDVKPPEITDTSALLLHRRQLDSTAFVIGDNWLRKNRYGLYEMYVSGAPFERGVINGKLSRELLVEQEQAFTDQIKKMIPSPGYLKFLKYVVGFMNRDLPEHVLPEYKKEIYGISFSADPRFRWIGTEYARQLNYHAAHDIGHALQNLMLVGCTSFGAWDAKTENGALILGRNFDFWVGDAFAKNKIVSFVHPTSGHNFAFVTWGGFIGVVSGMNDKGLTVTINAAKSRIPTDAATPVSLVAREILQYAGNIQEAVAIAHKRTMFVSESFLIGSAADHKSVIIEKTPDTLAVYDPGSDQIVCTNHYQSQLFQKQKLNEEQIAGSASVYRFNRVEQLLRNHYPLTPEKVAAILRDHDGMNNTDIGLGNEKAVNQFIAHHSVIFMPDSLRMWVSTAPWQMGTYVCYDLRKIFAMKGLSTDVAVADTALNIPPDPFLKTSAFLHYLEYRQERQELQDGGDIKTDISAFIHNNPEYYGTYVIAGDYWMKKQQPARAEKLYREALTKVIATEGERKSIEKKWKKARKQP